MKTLRVQNVLKKLEEQQLSQMIISDPASIFYLTGRRVDPGERLFALYLNSNGKHRIFINELFTVPEDLGIEKLWFSDIDDSLSLLASVIDHSKPLGIDKNMPARFLLGLMERNAAPQYTNASLCVDAVRACKDREEQELMRRASYLNSISMKQFRSLVHDGCTEEGVASEMLSIYKANGADGYSFEPLVGFGANAAIGHHEPDSTILKEGNCVLYDVGCGFSSYCADMTRTYFYRSVSPKQREVYELVKLANESAEAIIKPGVRFCDIDRAARKVIEDAGFGEYFTHRLGHSIGIEVHEFGDVSSVNTGTIQPGMTFSIEPGIYLPGEFGVRIEDLVLVTETGVEVLNSACSKELEVIG